MDLTHYFILKYTAYYYKSGKECYTGESSSSVFERTLEHSDDARKMERDSYQVKHWFIGESPGWWWKRVLWIKRGRKQEEEDVLWEYFLFKKGEFSKDILSLNTTSGGGIK